MAKKYITVNEYCRKQFGEKVYKLALSASVTCPNRDGTRGYGGCAFCSLGGSGDFAAPQALDIGKQIEWAKNRLGEKGKNKRYIAYFQSFTGTYGNIDSLERAYIESAEHPEIVGVSVATRPDCLGKREIDMLKAVNDIKPLWVELGLQTSNDETAHLFNRGYETKEYDEALALLKPLGVHIITHIIFGLPHETREDMLNTVRYVAGKTDGIKLQLLHVLKNTRLAQSYENGEFKCMEMNEYIDTVCDAVELLPEETVIHRLTGDGAKKDLLAPLWSADKKNVLNSLNRELCKRNIIRKMEV